MVSHQGRGKGYHKSELRKKSGATIMIGYAINGNLAEGENYKAEVIFRTFANRYR